MSINAKTKVCMVIGDPISHSLSPQMHNAGYKALNIDNDFVYVACRVTVENIPDFIKGVRVMGIRGVSCTVPHKEKVLPYLDRVNEIAQKIGAVNTIVNDDGILTGYNTDWLGVVRSLEAVTVLKDRKVAVIGAGGTARAVVYGLVNRGAHVSIFNRTFEKAESLAVAFGAKVEHMADLVRVRNAQIIVNATKVGMSDDDSPIPVAFLTPGQIVFDAVYKPSGTRLSREAKTNGAMVVPGAEMLLQQGVEQFALYTGSSPPIEAMRKALLQRLG